MEISDAAGSGGEKGTQVLMLKDQQAQPKWEAVEQILIQAKQAQEKLIRESMKLKDKVIKAGDGELTKAFKESLAVLQDNDRKLDQIIMWKAGLGTRVLSQTVFWGTYRVLARFESRSTLREGAL